MVFKRRDRQSWGVRLREAFWPRGGWARGFQYMRYRLNRLPDRPERIARGVFAGVFISCTPLFGLHLVLCMLIALMIRGNVLASVIASFFGNPVTIPFIAMAGLELGRRLLGVSGSAIGAEHLTEIFANAFADLQHNFIAIFTDDVTRWSGLAGFWDRIFLPYMVGGVILGVVSGMICYFVTLSLVRAYQTRRQAKLRKRLEKARARISGREVVPTSATRKQS